LLLIYSNTITPRLVYTLDFCFQGFSGEWKLTQSKEEYLNHSEFGLNCSLDSLKQQELHLPVSSIMTNDKVNALDLSSKDFEGCHVIFPMDRGVFGFDILGNIFYHLSRYEEYLENERDAHGRFPAKKAWLYLHNQLNIPAADRLVRLLQEKITQHSGINFITPKPTSMLTVDIDNAYAYRGKGWLRNLVGLVKDMLSKPNEAALRLRVLMGKSPDPYDSYAYLEQTLQSVNIRTKFFLLLADYAPFDKNCLWNSKEMKLLIKQLKSLGELGIHPSYQSFGKKSTILNEINRLSFLSGNEVTISRQHFLRFKLPETYRDLIELEIEEEYSMGYAEIPGFRAGTCRPFHFFDLKRNEKTNLKLYPLTVMDGTLNEYLKFDIPKAINQVNELKNTVREYGGCFVSLWHNDTLSEVRHWKGWRSVFEQCINE
jgi:hypothetical protein